MLCRQFWRPAAGPILAAALLICSILIGCRGTAGPPVPNPEPFTGPPITIDSGGPEHVLVAQLPNPGYRFALDAVREDFNHRDVFVTFRRPSPTVIYPQVLVQQRLATGVKSQIPITVYARVVDYDATSTRNSHAKAAESSPPPGTGR